jgi:hypothetical protein
MTNVEEDTVASTDWAYLSDGLDINMVDRGVTAGVEAPRGGGDFVFGFNSLAVTQGAVGLFVAQPNFAPMPKGGSVRGALQRGPGGGPTGFSPFLFLCVRGPSVRDSGYLLGLSDEEPHRIVLKKGPLMHGVGEADGPGVLLRSGESFAQGSWLHLRLDAIVNDNGDVVLQAFMNDVEQHQLGTSPEWREIEGMPRFVDDQLAINTGSQPFTSGRGGFGFAVGDVTRRAYFDHLEVARQV